jgi:hypothetical protein
MKLMLSKRTHSTALLQTHKKPQVLQTHKKPQVQQSSITVALPALLTRERNVGMRMGMWMLLVLRMLLVPLKE